MVEPRATLYIEINDKRPREQKVALAKTLAAACVEGAGLEPDHVSIRFMIVNHDNVARGPTLLTELLK